LNDVARRDCEGLTENRGLKAPLQIDTPRLRLSRPTVRDAEAVFERYASDPDVTQFVGWPLHRSIDDTRAFLNFSASEWERWPAGPYLIRSRSDGRLLGSTGLGFETPAEAATGYVAKDAWGQGYATEALRAMMELALRIGVARLHALFHPQHRASWRVLEKCGFVRDLTWSRQAEFPNLAPGLLQNVLRYVVVLDSSTRQAGWQTVARLEPTGGAGAQPFYVDVLGFSTGLWRRVRWLELLVARRLKLMLGECPSDYINPTRRRSAWKRGCDRTGSSLGSTFK
jgi:ribosomal-protein-alanine N-acetyltransferase